MAKHFCKGKNVTKTFVKNSLVNSDMLQEHSTVEHGCNIMKGSE